MSVNLARASLRAVVGHELVIVNKSERMDSWVFFIRESLECGHVVDKPTGWGYSPALKRKCLPCLQALTDEAMAKYRSVSV